MGRDFGLGRWFSIFDPGLSMLSPTRIIGDITWSLGGVGNAIIVRELPSQLVSLIAM